MSQTSPVPIVQNGDPVLRELAQSVPIKEIGSAKFQKIMRDMKAALASQSDGVAIAAPQIAQPFRIFIVASSALRMIDEEYAGGDLVFINPEIKKLSRQKHEVEEGCLSVRYLYGKVKRSKKASVRAYDETGKRFERGASGLLAQIFQHETDHLDGILFIDHAYDVQEVLPEELE
jgi:peptide deformylase